MSIKEILKGSYIVITCKGLAHKSLFHRLKLVFNMLFNIKKGGVK